MHLHSRLPRKRSGRFRRMVRLSMRPTLRISHREPSWGGLLLPLLVAVYPFVYETYSSLSFHVRVTIRFIITPSLILITAG